ncbi:hypothetical protein SAMN05216215_101533 [Saccharopolyspora shandongensis]|uniref:Uncharacterized protein n=1 Tax=Saccharopolyspora shandongensis TaxID=418495 RepID=A0A1H3EK78_9PSEU|nr:hypothetical protein SAMN05216215_101533 [Saccharopolyspora shandongensis]
MRLRRMRQPIDVQLCDPRLRADQDEKRSLKLRKLSTVFGVSWSDTPKESSFN